MPATLPLPNPESDPRVKTVFDDIRATRKTDLINNLWLALAFSPDLLANGLQVTVDPVFDAGARPRPG